MPAEQTSFDIWTQLQRVIPICTTTDLDEETAYEVQAFLEDVESTPDLIVMFNARGWSVWSSEDMELSRSNSRTARGGDDVVLRMHLGRALRELMPRGEDGEAMELE